MDKNELVALVQRAQNKDNTAMEDLFSKYYNDVYYFALKTLKDSDLACDITQETFLEVVKSIDKLKEPAAFEKWLRMVTYHQCTRYFKKKKDVLVSEDEDGNTLFDELVDDDEAVVPQQVYENEEFQSTIMGMVNELSEEQRSAVMLYYFDELSISEIAQIQGVSEGTVKSRLNYARKGIKKSVESYEEKHGIKLHAIPFLPIIKLGFGATEAMSTANLMAIKTAISNTAASIASGVSSVTATSSATSTTATATAKASTVASVVSKIKALPLAVKIIAGVVTAGIVMGIITIGVIIIATVGIFTFTSDSAENSTPVVQEETSVVYAEETQSDVEDDYAENGYIVKDEAIATVDSDAYFVLSSDGTVETDAGFTSPLASSPSKWNEIYDKYWEELSDWSDIVALSASFEHLVGLKSDGTVVAIGDNQYGECDVYGWTDIVQVEAAYNCTYGVKSDGTVVAAGDVLWPEVYEWTDVKKIVVSEYGSDIVGLRNDGTLLFCVDGLYDDNEVNTFYGVKDVCCAMDGEYDVWYVLNNDGTVYEYYELPTGEGRYLWNEVVEIGANKQAPVGLKADGSVVCECSDNFYERFSDFEDVVDIIVKPELILGIKSDGTIVVAYTAFQLPFFDY